MTAKEAIEYIHSIGWSTGSVGLDRIRELCALLGNPQDRLRFVHVAGTNGKGSTCSMLASVLHIAGYRTGLFTSPYIREFNERMGIDGENISDEALGEVTDYVKQFADRMTDKPTEFELITAIGFVYFAREKCDVVVLETGLGGRLDSTNIISTPDLCVITGIDLDHTSILGDTYAKIAAEKAGIIKPACPVVVGDCNAESMAVISEQAKSRGASFHCVDLSKLINVQYTLDGAIFDYADYANISISLAGVYQPRNCATVLECVDALRRNGYAISEEALRRGLMNARWMARFEVLSRDPLVIYDGGHNPQGVRACVESVKAVLPNQRVCVLCGILRDKDYEHMITALSEIADSVVTLTVDSPRALPAKELADTLTSRGICAEAAVSAKEAVECAYRKAKEKGIPLLMIGSLYMYSQIIDFVKQLLSEGK